MRSTTLMRAGKAPAPTSEAFALHGMRVFTEVPEHHHGIVALRGAVVIYETDTLYREKLQDGGFYVIESQHTPSRMQWQTWLRTELQDEHVERRAQPSSPLRTTREVVQLVRRPAGGQDRWWHRLSSGFHDGPFYDWAVALHIVGKVVGIYAPPYGQKGEA